VAAWRMSGDRRAEAMGFESYQAYQVFDPWFSLVQYPLGEANPVVRPPDSAPSSARSDTRSGTPLGPESRRGAVWPSRSRGSITRSSG
jgi:hypothetical protein